MLSKSAARAFFVGGTALCSLAFIGLTVDTIGRIPAQTHEENLTPAVIRGKNLWDESNCMGCHTLLGEGAYYAPELTRVYERRGPEFIAAMLRDPAAMYPGARRMEQYDFTDEEIADLVAFLAWVNEMDLNGFPAPPTLASAAAPSASSTSPVASGAGRPRVFEQMCVACHAIDGRGGSVGPALDGVADRVEPDFFERWLRDPAAVRPGTAMPRLPLSDAQLAELVAFLSQQHTEGAE
ncbi:MAG: c-type cytochrome [Deltaproteobacteria bacterium]|nr:c-type cytochrome [Deltaproteobacteria bacterium]